LLRQKKVTKEKALGARAAALCLVGENLIQARSFLIVMLRYAPPQSEQDAAVRLVSF